MDLAIIRKFMEKVQALDMLFQDMQTLKQQEIGLKLLTSLLKRNETRLGGRFKMKTVIWYNMKDFEKLFDMCYTILFTPESESLTKDKFITCLGQFSISDYDIVKNLEEIVRKLAVQFDTIEMTLDYNDENSVLASENDSNDYIMGIDVNYDTKECPDRIDYYGNSDRKISDELNNETDLEVFKTNLKTSDVPIELRFNFNDEVKECAIDESLDGAIKETTERVDGSYSSYSSQSTSLNKDGNDVLIAIKQEIFHDTNVSDLSSSSNTELLVHNEKLENENFDLDRSSMEESNTSCLHKNSNVRSSDSLSATSESQTTKHFLKKAQETNLNEEKLIRIRFPDEEHGIDDTSSEIDISCEAEYKIGMLNERNSVINHSEQSKTVEKKMKPVDTSSNCSKSKIEKILESVSSPYQGKQKTKLLPESPSPKSINKKFDCAPDKHGHFTRSTNKNFKVSSLLKNKKARKLKRQDTPYSEDEIIDHNLEDEAASTVCSDKENDITRSRFSKSVEQTTNHNFEIRREYPCSLCEKKLPTQKSVFRHMKLVHDSVPDNTHVNHNRMTKNGHNVKKVGRRYLCDVCNLTFDTQQCYVKHTRTVKHCNRLGLQDVERTYLCQLCGKAYLRKDALKRHEKYHSGEKSHMCQFCGYKCRENHNLKRHIALHFESQRNFVCEICGAAFHTKKTMEVHHQFKHSEDRNYKCESCDKAFKAKSTLIRHKKVHNQAKDNRCWCGSAFKTLYNLRRHMKCTHGSDSKLPSKHYVKTLDCPVKTTVSKTDYLSKAEKQTTEKMGNKPACLEGPLKKRDNFQYSEDKYNSEDDSNEPGHRDDTFNQTVIHDTGIDEEQTEINFAYKTQVITRIPTIESFRHISQPNETFSTEEYVESRLQSNDHVQVSESAKVKVTGSYLSDGVEAGEDISDRDKANVPHFSLYGYPSPYSSSIPQFMYMQPGLPRFEPSIHPSLSYMSYDQLAKLGPALQTTIPQSIVINRLGDTEISKADDVASYQHTAPSLSQDQLRVLHHEIYSRLSQEEIAQRLNVHTNHHSLSQIDDPEQHKLKLQHAYDQYSNSLSHRPIDDARERLDLHNYDQICDSKQQINTDTYTKDISEINGAEIKLDNTQSTVPFDYTDRKDCAFEGQGEETLQVSKLGNKTHLDQSQEDMYDTSIDADYLQSRREMAAESLALMSALTPESAYGGQELNDQML